MKRAEVCFRKAIQFTGTDYSHANYLILQLSRPADAEKRFREVTSQRAV